MCKSITFRYVYIHIKYVWMNLCMYIDNYWYMMYTQAITNTHRYTYINIYIYIHMHMNMIYDTCIFCILLHNVNTIQRDLCFVFFCFHSIVRFSMPWAPRRPKARNPGVVSQTESLHIVFPITATICHYIPTMYIIHLMYSICDFNIFIVKNETYFHVQLIQIISQIKMITMHDVNSWGKTVNYANSIIMS